MSFFKIRPARIVVEIPVEIYLRERGSDIVSLKSLSGFLVNFSKKGATIVVSKVMLSGDHVFFSSQDNKNYHLYIPGVIKKGQDKCDLIGISIWMDGCTFRGQPSFKIGIEFLQRQEELYSFLKKKF